MMGWKAFYNTFALGAVIGSVATGVFGSLPDFSPDFFFVFVLVGAIIYRLATQWLDRNKSKE
jgi:hypothetical protein